MNLNGDKSYLQVPRSEYPHSTKLITHSSVDDNVSAIVAGIQNLHDIDYNNELASSKKIAIMQWLYKTSQSVPKRDHSIQLQSSGDSPGNFYMFGLESVGPIYYKKINTDNKLFLKVLFNLYDGEMGEYCSRSLMTSGYWLQQGGAEGYQKSKDRARNQTSSIYSYQQKICVYLYTYRKTSLRIKIDCILFQAAYAPQKQLKQIIISETILGNAEVDIFQSSKTKTQDFLRLGSTLGVEQKNSVNTKTEIKIEFSVVNSDGYRILQKLIPPDCLVNAEDEIAGIMGGRMPLNQYSVSKIQYVELNSVKIDVTGITLPSQLIQESLKMAQKIIAGMYPECHINSSHHKEFRLGLYFHNGWHNVTKSQIVIRQKMQVQKKISKNQINNNMDKSQTKWNGDKSHKQHKEHSHQQIVKISKFIAEDVGCLPLVFLGSHCMLIIEVSSKVQVKFARNKESLSQTVDLPLCCCYHPFNERAQSFDQKHSSILHNGPHTISPKTHLPIPLNSLQAENPQAYIDYYLHMEPVNKMEYSQRLMAKSKTMGVVNDREKIMLEKERIMKENRRVKKEFRKRKIQMNQQIPLLDVNEIREKVYREQLEGLRLEKVEKQEMLKFLQGKCQEYMESTQTPNKFGNKGEFYTTVGANQQLQQPSNSFPLQHHTDGIYYRAVLHTNQLQQLSRNLASCIEFPLADYSDVPAQVLKTELQQGGYSYLFFINVLRITPLSHQTLMPRKFVFKINLFTKTIVSKAFKLNEMTGEIIAVEKDGIDSRKQTKNLKMQQKLQQKPQKEKPTQLGEYKTSTDNSIRIETILHLQFPPSKTTNWQSNLLKFISYMHSGYMQVNIIDIEKNMLFGRSYYPLRELIRKRRSEATYTNEAFIFGNCGRKGKLRVQMRSLRKEPGVGGIDKESYVGNINDIPEPHNNVQQQKLQLVNATSEESRQMLRINRYKTQKNPEGDVKLKQVKRVIEDEFMGQKGQIHISVSMMEREIFFIEFENKDNFQQNFKVMINDQDEAYLEGEVQCQILTQIKNGQLHKGYYGSILQAPFNLKVLDFQGLLKLGPNERANVPMQYYSKRKHLTALHTNIPIYKHKQTQTLQQILQEQTYNSRVHNHPHSIIVSLINAQTGIVSSLHRINIIPLPPFNIMRAPLFRRAKSTLQVLLKGLSVTQGCKLYIDDPMTTFNSKSRSDNNSELVMQCIASEIPNKRKEVNISVVDSVEDRLLRSVCLELWAGEEVIVEGGLWQATEVLLQIPTSQLLQRGISELLVLAEDQRVIKSREKNPISLVKDKLFTLVRLQVTSNKVGKNYYEVNGCHPVTRDIVVRYVLVVQTSMPSIKQYSTLHLRPSDYLLQEPFSYHNPLPRKAVFKIYSTRPELLYCVVDTIEIEAKSDKKVGIKINAEEVPGEGASVVVGFKNEKILECFMISFVRRG